MYLCQTHVLADIHRQEDYVSLSGNNHQKSFQDLQVQVCLLQGFEVLHRFCLIITPSVTLLPFLSTLYHLAIFYRVTGLCFCPEVPWNSTRKEVILLIVLLSNFPSYRCEILLPLKKSFSSLVHSFNMFTIYGNYEQRMWWICDQLCVCLCVF